MKNWRLRQSHNEITTAVMGTTKDIETEKKEWIPARKKQVLERIPGQN